MRGSRQPFRKPHETPALRVGAVVVAPSHSLLIPYGCLCEAAGRAQLNSGITSAANSRSDSLMSSLGMRPRRLNSRMHWSMCGS